MQTAEADPVRPAAAARAARAPAARVRSRVRLLALGLAPLLALAGVATPFEELGAQAPDSVRADSLDAWILAPLRVTVLRDPASLAPGPYAVSALEAATFRAGETGAFLEDALDLLPGVQVQNRYNFAVGERLAVRGFGSRAQFGVRGVKVVVDGVPATLPDGQTTLDHVDMTTIGRVELLRGPASAYWGNAAAGVLVLRTAAPAPGPLRPSLRVSGGSHGLVNATAAVSGTVAGTGVTAAATRLRWSGFRVDPTSDDADDVYGAADRWLLTGLAERRLAGGDLRLSLHAVDLQAENPGSLAREAFDEDADAPPAFRFNVLQSTGKEIRQGQLGATWARALGADATAGATRLEAGTWVVRRDLVNPIPSDVIAVDRVGGGARVLLGGVLDAGAGEASSPAGSAGGGPVDWSVGAEWEVQRDDRRNFENDGGERGALTLDQEERVQSFGGFARVSADVPLLPLRATAAVRGDRVRFEADDRFVGADPSGDPDDSGERTLAGWSPTVGVVARPTGSVDLWANYSTSFETPSTTELVNRPSGAGGFNEELEPRRTRGWEVGVRRHADGALPLRAELVFFRVDVDDELVPFEVPDAPGRTFFRNAGAAEHRGIEAVVAAELPAGLDATATWTRTDARFERYVVDGEDFSGRRIPGLAPDRVAGRLAQRAGRWFWAAEATWTDAVPVDDANTVEADAYTLLDLRAGLLDLRAGGWRVEPYVGVSNVLDVVHAASVVPNAFGARYFEPGPGRSAHLGMSLTPIR